MAQDLVVEIWFPAYRGHDQARIRANDAMMALVASSRLADRVLTDIEDQTILLPNAFPAVPNLERMNRSVGDARSLISRAEREFVYMAIPYLLSMHHVYAASCIDLIRSEGLGGSPTSRPWGSKWSTHGLLKSVVNHFPNDLVSLWGEMPFSSRDVGARVQGRVARGLKLSLGRW